MKEININVFEDTNDNYVKALPTSWENIVGYFTSEHQLKGKKIDAKLFSGVRYKNIDDVPKYSKDWEIDEQSGKSYVLRRQVNILESDLLVLDYDKDITFKEAMEGFKNYEFVAYTSYNHLKDGKTEKFRMIFPYVKPIPSNKGGEFYQITESLKKFAGPCDPTSFNPNAMFYVPSVHPSRKELSQSIHNEGKWLDWTKFEKTPLEKSQNEHFSYKSGNSVRSTGKFLEPDQVLQTKNGSIVVSDITGTINGVLCPFHDDTKPTEFVKKSPKGHIFLYCRTCDETFYMRNDSYASNQLAIKNLKKTPKTPDKNRVYTIDELLTFDEPTTIYQDGSDRKRAIEQLQGIKKEIDDDKGYTPSMTHIVYTDLSMRKYKSHIIFMPEGSGKSYLVVNMAEEGQKIIFACKSWEQAEGKYEEFKKQGVDKGFNVGIVRSKEAKVRKFFNTKLIRGEQNHPFASPYINDDASIEELIKNNPHVSSEMIRLMWEFLSPDQFSFEKNDHVEIVEYEDGYDETLVQPITDNPKIIITSFEQLRIHKLKNINIPKDWIIWFDDPDIQDVSDIELYDTRKWNELSDDELENKTTEINGRRYFKRNFNQSLGYPLTEYKCIYTTTEVITHRALESMMKKREETLVVHDQMDNISGGKITVLGTNKVRKRYDGIIPLLIRRLEKNKFKARLIADGLSSELNHSNNKGRNDLDKTNLVVKLSIPHPNQIRTICDALEIPFKVNQNEITRLLMLDRLHQAIGRNSGYRWKGFEAVVLVDSQFHKKIVEETRYKIDSKNSVLVDQTQSMSKKDKRTSQSASLIVQEIENLLNRLDDYVSDLRKVKPDINYVLKAIEESQKRHSYIVRLLVSLSQLSGVEIKQDLPKLSSFIQQNYSNLISWIFEKHIPVHDHGKVIRDIQNMIKEIEKPQ